VVKATAPGYSSDEISFLANVDQRVELRLKRKKPKSLVETQGLEGADDAQVKTLEKLLKKLGDAAKEE
jgi:hypothetical protein